jgi:hypothetical protein
MAIVVEDGTGVTGANSYVSLTEVGTYCSTRGLDEWAAAVSDAVREAALLRGMDYIDSIPFKGEKEDFQNELEWPRVGWYDAISYGSVEYTTGAYDAYIPDGLKKATCRAAYEEILSTGVLQAASTRDDYVQTKTIDVISTTYFEGAENTRGDFPVVLGHLKGLLKTGARVKRT